MNLSWKKTRAALTAIALFGAALVAIGTVFATVEEYRFWVNHHELDEVANDADAKVQLVAQGLTAVIEGQKVNTRQGLRNERRYWTDVRRQAEDDLKKYPGNVSAQRELERAEESIRYIDDQLMKE